MVIIIIMDFKKIIIFVQDMLKYVGVRVNLYSLLTSVLHEGEWLASHPGRFIHWKSAPSIYRIGSFAGLGDFVDVLEKKTSYFPCGEWHKISVTQPVA